MSFARPLAASAFAILACIAAAQGFQSPPSTARSPQAMAELAGVAPEIAQLRTIAAGSAPADKWQVLWLHQRITEQVLAASLQVDATMAQIDNEIARANELRGYLADRRDRTVSRLNLVSILVSGGVGATSSGLQLSSSLTKPAAAVGIGAGAASAALALTGLHAQNGRSSRFDFNSNMLAELFDRPALPDSRYPSTVWAFLNQPAPGGPPGVTRRQNLVQNWIQVRRIDSAASTAKIDRISSQPSQNLQLSIDDFEDRAAMLQDVRARISFLKRDLAALLTSLPVTPQGTSTHAP